MRTRRQAARAKPEPPAVLFSSDDETTPKPEAKRAKRTPARRQKKETSPVGRTKKTSKTSEEEKKKQEEEKEQSLQEVKEPLPPKSQEEGKEEPLLAVDKPLPATSQESRDEKTKQPKPRQSLGTTSSATAGLFTRTYDLRSVHRHQATSRLVGLSSDEDETSVAGGTPTQKSAVDTRMSLSESKFRKRLVKMQTGQPTVPTQSSPSVTRRLQFTSAADTGSKEPAEAQDEQQQGGTSDSATTEERLSFAQEATVSSEPQEVRAEEERVPAWMQIARAEVGFAVFVTLLGIVGYFCYSTDHCSQFYP